nr:EscU/YscU/HrcU family type III secretion system export apparatus switch protein [Roseospira visakhapatnamensis]
MGYDPEAGRAPTVLAKGRGGIAEQIVALAFANDIKVREDADLVQILAAIDLDSEIPLEALAAVAEILSYVYRANGRLALDAPPGPGEEGVDEDDAAVFRRSLRVALGEDDAVDEDESPGAEGHHREGA